MRRLIALLLLATPIILTADSAADRHALFSRIRPTSLREFLLFSTLYPESDEGKEALEQAWKILTGNSSENPPPLPLHFELVATSLITLIQPSLAIEDHRPQIPEETVSLIDSIGKNLPHRSLKGHGATTLQELEGVPPEEIDLARALVLLDGPQSKRLTAVEAALDILALEIMSRIGPNATDEQKISAITELLFHDIQLRFPPESEANEKTKQFSDLSSVLFSRRGVCLGASALYLTLAQRIGLSLSIYTPPGHIFVAHKSSERTHVIETTARGIDIPIEYYLGLSLKSLPERTMKEVVGMVLFNRAAEHLKNKSWKEALELYQKASLFETDDELQLMISLCELLSGQKNLSQEQAKRTLSKMPEYRIEPDLLLVDLAEGTLSPQAAEAIIEFSDAEGDEILNAIAVFQKMTAANPNSRTLPFHMAHAYLAYGKPKDALPILELLSKRENTPCSIHALLAFLYKERMNVMGAWSETRMAIAAAKKQGFLPRPLRQLVLDLQQESPNCTDISDLL